MSCVRWSKPPGGGPRLPATLTLLATLMTLIVSGCERGSNAGNANATRMADREAIEMTLERYTRGLDRLDAELYVSSFAANGVLTIYEKAFQGHEALRRIVAEEARLRQSQRDSGQAPRTLFHLETNSTVEFSSPVRAVHHAYWLTATRAGAEPQGLSLLGVGSSIDELQKIDGKWLITRREIHSEP
jgi:hypothetical protein